MKMLSLFAGAGGLDIGLEQAGLTTVLANELEEYACKTLVENRALRNLNRDEFDTWFDLQLTQRCYRGISAEDANQLRNRLLPAIREGKGILDQAQILQGDIRQFSSEELAAAARVDVGELYLVAGGPPCQPFSRAGKRQTLDVADGQLFMEFVRVVKDLQPRWLLFENVKGLILSKTEVVYQVCDACGAEFLPRFQERQAILDGELTAGTCICASGKGEVVVKNVRGGSLEVILGEFERIGYKCSWKILNAVDYGAPQNRERLIIVGSRDGEHFIWPEPTHELVQDKSYNEVSQRPLFEAGTHSRKPAQTMVDALWPDGHPEFGVLDEDRAVLWVKNVVRPHDEPVTWHLRRPSPTIGAHQAAKLAIAPEGVPAEQLARQQWHVRGKRQGDTPPVDVKHAYLSDRELLRLQTFPDTWYLYGTRMQRAFQVGNAVPVSLARALGQALVASSGLNVENSRDEVALQCSTD